MNKPAIIDVNNFNLRIFFAAIFVILSFIALFSRLIWLQVIKYDLYHTKAEQNRITIVPTIPKRGKIFDRNGIILADNYPGLSLEIKRNIFNQDSKKIYDSINFLQKIIPISHNDLRRFNNNIRDKKNFSNVALRYNLTPIEIAKIAVVQSELPGIEIKPRLTRYYPFNETASHIIGYIGRLSSADKQKLQQVSNENYNSKSYHANKNINNYNGTQHIGKNGIERSYEYQLHGTTGSEQVEVNSSGRALNSLSNTKPIDGENINLSIDIKLQKLVEDLYGDNKGAFIAMNPQNGEILAMISKPNFNLNLFVEGLDKNNWDKLNNDINKPLLNRAIKSTYPPGSTYKPFMALAGLELGYINSEFTIQDSGKFILDGHTFKDDKIGGHGKVDLYKSIVESCDTYYYMLAQRLGVDTIHDFMYKFGFGQKTGVDIDNEVSGILPSVEWKKKFFKSKKNKDTTWYDGETISLGIGQGYNNFTILQLAQALSKLVMNGNLFLPHLVINKHNIKLNHQTPLKFNVNNIQIIKNSMLGVNKEGTSAKAFMGTEYIVGGKTGTAQVFSLKGQKYNSKNIHKSLHDHALYIAFANKKDSQIPQIVIAMIVENGGFGAESAAPIARMALDYFFLNKWPQHIAPFNTDNLIPKPNQTIINTHTQLIDMMSLKKLP